MEKSSLLDYKMDIKHAGAETPSFAITGTYEAKIVNVVDGDTVDAVFYFRGKLNKFRLRLAGINAPEMKPRKSIENREQVKEDAMISTQYLTDQVLNKVITIECHKQGNFGRVLATLHCDGVNVNEKMLELGFAVPYGRMDY